MTVPTNAHETLLISAEGYELRNRELEVLRNEGRRELGEHLRDARRDGDLDDNPALYDLLEEHEQLERRIAQLEAQLAAAEIVAPAADGRAGIGSLVHVRDSDGETFEFELVGPLESDLVGGRISIGAPVGRALLGQRAGARVEVTAPRGRLTLDIVSVRPRAAAALAAASVLPPRELHESIAEPLRQFRCADCGYGVSCPAAPERCPMCGGHLWIGRSTSPVSATM